MKGASASLTYKGNSKHRWVGLVERNAQNYAKPYSQQRPPYQHLHAQPSAFEAVPRCSLLACHTSTKLSRIINLVTLCIPHLISFDSSTDKQILVLATTNTKGSKICGSSKQNWKNHDPPGFDERLITCLEGRIMSLNFR